LQERRSVWGEKDHSLTGMIIPKEWKEEWEKDRINRKLDKNAESIRKKMEKEFTEYLGLKN
jgi:hypothetical protein